MSAGPSRSDALWVGITGVLPQYRRRGIGLALKLAVIEYAQAHGYAEIHTSNSSPNVGMLALNETLGFRQVAARAGYELAVQPNEVGPVMRRFQ